MADHRDLFADDRVPLDVLRERAFNLRWAAVAPDVIPLTAADPDFPVAPAITEAMGRYLAPGVLSYGPPEGLPSFREEVARFFVERRGLAAEADRVLATDGAAAAMFVVARWALEPGDEAIVFDPVDFLFAASVEAAGGRVRRCTVDPSTGRFDPDQMRALVGPRTRMIGLCHPHNPLGRVWEDDELGAIAEIAVEHDLVVLSDEIWSDIVYRPARFRSFATLGPEIARRTVTVYGFSKTFGLAGLRVGCLLAPDADTARALLEVSRATTTATGVATLSQVAATAALRSAWPYATAFVDHLRDQRDYAVERLNRLPGVRCRPPEGTYVLFPDVRATGIDAITLAERLHAEARVALVPGAPRWFGPGAAGHLRLCVSTSRAILTEALDRVEGWLAD